MNIKKIKLALTVGLINSGTGSTLGKVRELMHSLKEDVGAMLSSQELKKAVLGPNMVQHSYALQFERCTLNVDVVFINLMYFCFYNDKPICKFFLIG